MKICSLSGNPLESRSFQGWIDELNKKRDTGKLADETADLLRILISSEICLQRDEQQDLEKIFSRIPLRDLSRKNGSLILQYALMEISAGKIPLRVQDDLIQLLEQDSETAAMAQLYRIKTRSPDEVKNSKTGWNQTSDRQLFQSR